MTALLALLSSLTFGASDFTGGLAARHASPFRVTVWSQSTSLVVAVVLASMVGADELTGRDIGFSLAAGVTTSFAVVAFYAALAEGTMSVIAPTTGVVGAAVATSWGVIQGDDLSATVVVGLVVAVIAMVLVTREPSGDRRSGKRPFLLAALAGVGFGLFFVALERTGDDAGLWPLVFARFVSIPAVTILALVFTRGVSLDQTARRLALFTGASEMIANTLILVALRRGPVAVAGVFGSLYPIGTALLAWVVLGERLSRVQQLGVGAAIAALVLVAI